ILIAIFVLACAGAAALLAARWPGLPLQRGRNRMDPGIDSGFTDGSGDPSDVGPERRRETAPLAAVLAAGVCYAWDPFVAERLIMGQWAMLLGYAGLPWVLRELTRRDGRIRIWRLAAAMIPAAVGGFAAMSVTVIAALAVAVCAGSGRQGRIRRL